jgi:hypothetical protein
MSTLPEWIESARETVDEAVQSRHTAAKNESASTAKELLVSEIQTLACLSTAVSVGRRHGWVATPSPQSAAGTRSALEAVVTKGALRRDVNQLQKTLPRYVTQLNAEVEREWTQHVQDRVGRIDDLDALIRLMAALPGQESQRDLLEKLRKPLLDLAKTLPTESSDAALTATAEQFETAFSQAFGNDDVRQFLLACSRTGATLDQLTANVSEWLKQTGADQLLRIRLGQISA